MVERLLCLLEYCWNVVCNEDLIVASWHTTEDRRLLSRQTSLIDFGEWFFDMLMRSLNQENIMVLLHAWYNNWTFEVHCERQEIAKMLICRLSDVLQSQAWWEFACRPTCVPWRTLSMPSRQDLNNFLPHFVYVIVLQINTNATASTRQWKWR